MLDQPSVLGGKPLHDQRVGRENLNFAIPTPVPEAVWAAAELRKQADLPFKLCRRATIAFLAAGATEGNIDSFTRRQRKPMGRMPVRFSHPAV